LFRGGTNFVIGVILVFIGSFVLFTVGIGGFFYTIGGNLLVMGSYFLFFWMFKTSKSANSANISPILFLNYLSSIEGFSILGVYF